MKMKQFQGMFVSWILLLFLIHSAQAEIKLPAMIGSNMVIQQEVKSVA